MEKKSYPLMTGLLLDTDLEIAVLDLVVSLFTPFVSTGDRVMLLVSSEHTKSVQRTLTE